MSKTCEQKSAEYLARLSQIEGEWNQEPEYCGGEAICEAREAFKSIFLPEIFAVESAARKQDLQDKWDYLVDRYGEAYAATVCITETSLEPEWSNHRRAEMRKPPYERSWNRGSDDVAI